MKTTFILLLLPCFLWGQVKVDSKAGSIKLSKEEAEDFALFAKVNPPNLRMAAYRDFTHYYHYKDYIVMITVRCVMKDSSVKIGDFVGNINKYSDIYYIPESFSHKDIFHLPDTVHDTIATGRSRTYTLKYNDPQSILTSRKSAIELAEAIGYKNINDIIRLAKRDIDRKIKAKENRTEKFPD